MNYLPYIIYELSLILFFLGGYLIGSARTERKEKNTILEQSEVKKQVVSSKVGVIEYPSQEEIDYVESGEERVDAERERVFREQFKP